MTGKRILIVEDEIIPAIFTKEILEQLGYEVIDIAVSGEKALEIIEKTSPDLVLMDVKLAGRISGIETARLISERFNLPVVFLSAHDDEETNKMLDGSGSYWFMQKPVEEGELQEIIRSALEKHGS
jgi:DNA-binding response OmpR family regulator